MTPDEIIEEIDRWAEDAGVAITLLGNTEDRHQYAEAIIGTITEPYPTVIYLRSKVVAVFVKQGMSHDEAWEYYEYNCVRALPYMKDPPIIVDDLPY